MSKAKSKIKSAPRASQSSKPVKKPSNAASKSKSKPGKPATPAKAKPAPKGADWRVEMLDRMRALILEAEPDMLEEQKWRKPSNGMIGVPVWSHNGIVCTGEKYTKAVKLTFAKGASVPDPTRLFNSSLDGGTRRAIDIAEGGKIDPRAFKALIKAAVALNGAPKKR